jgi:ubiquinone/menaquinone biosynthesis C-methylase UbiE
MPTLDALRAKYRFTGRLYDILDYPWERQYRRWRPALVGDLQGRVLEAGVGTGRNLAYYPAEAEVTGIDLSPVMLARAKRRTAQARCRVTLQEASATDLGFMPAGSFDAYVSTFMYCVMPDEFQPAALREMARLLRPGGHFRLLEMIGSQDPQIRARQRLWAPWVERVYGARFDRRTSEYLAKVPGLTITRRSFLKDDVYLLLEGERV